MVDETHERQKKKLKEDIEDLKSILLYEATADITKTYTLINRKGTTRQARNNLKDSLASWNLIKEAERVELE